jgi:hypothetical protein
MATIRIRNPVSQPPSIKDSITLRAYATGAGRRFM